MLITKIIDGYQALVEKKASRLGYRPFKGGAGISRVVGHSGLDCMALSGTFRARLLCGLALVPAAGTSKKSRNPVDEGREGLLDDVLDVGFGGAYRAVRALRARLVPDIAPCDGDCRANRIVAGVRRRA
jgi:hypothetical protein